MFAFIASAVVAIAGLFGSIPAEGPVTEYLPYNAPAEVNPFEGMTAAECGALPDYRSTHDCVMALWEMGTLDLEACEREDSADCVWINRGGSDFVDVNGYAYYLPQVLTA